MVDIKDITDTTGMRLYVSKSPGVYAYAFGGGCT